MYRHCHLSLCENKKQNVHFWRMMQLEILNHHCFVCMCVCVYIKRRRRRREQKRKKI